METLNSRFLETLGRNSAEAGVLVLVVALAQWGLGKKIAPRWRCTLWLLVMARLLLPVSAGSGVSLFNLTPHLGPQPQDVQPVLAVPVRAPLPSPGAAATPAVVPNLRPAAQSSVSPGPAIPPIQSSSVQTPAALMHLSWPSVLCAGWLAGVLFFAGYMLLCICRLRRRFAKLAPVTDASLLALLRECRAALGVGGELTLAECPTLATPALYGFWRPKLLLPAGFTGRFSTPEQRFILLHELAHVRRRDILFNWLATLLQIPHWFNPLIWYGFARWRADRELACDALALEAAGAEQNQAYGRTILRLVDQFTPQAAVPGLVGILEDKRQLQQRIRMIAGFRPGKKFGLLAAALFAVIGVICLTDARIQTAETARPVVTKGPAMKVTVLDDTTGQPLDQAEVFAPNEVTFFDFHGKEHSPRWITGPDGTARIRLGELSTNHLAQENGFSLSVRRAGHAPHGLSWSDDKKDVRTAMPKEITVRLKPGVTVGGVVSDEAGTPQPGVKIRMYGRDHWAEPRPEFPEFWNDSVGAELPVTDAAGRWQVNDFPADLQNVAIEFIRPDGSVAKFRHPELADNPIEPQGEPMDYAGLLAGQARFVLKSGHELAGLVVDPQGRPLPGVRIRSGYGVVNVERAGEVQSDAAGRFALPHLNHKNVILTAEAAGYAITSLVVDVTSNLPEVRLSLDPLAPLQIKVVDGGGHAMAGVKVNSEQYGTEGQLLDFAGSTDSQGRLIWTNAPVSAFVLGASVPKVELRQLIYLLPDQREATFHLRAGMSEEIIVNGRARDARTGAPVELELVRYQTGDREGFKWDAEVSGSGFHMAVPATRFRPHGMVPTIQLELKAAGYAPLITPWRHFDEGDWSPDLVLQSASVAGETLSLPDGRPAAGAQFWIPLEEGGGGFLILNQSGTYYEQRLIKSQTDARGGFILPDMAADDLPVVFKDAEGFLATSVAEVKHQPNLRLQPWGRVEGVLKIGGRPQGGVEVWLNVLGAPSWQGYYLTYDTKTAPDGEFVFTNVPTGEYQLYRNPAARIGRSITADHQMPLVVKAGATTKIEYSQPGRVISGRAQPDHPDASVDWQNDDHTLTIKQPAIPPVNLKDYASVAAFYQARKKSETSPESLQRARAARTYVLDFAPDGSFRAEDVPPGTYELKIHVTKPGTVETPGVQENPANVLGSLTREVVVPPGDGPLDLGTVIVPIKGK